MTDNEITLDVNSNGFTTYKCCNLTFIYRDVRGFIIIRDMKVLKGTLHYQLIMHKC